MTTPTSDNQDRESPPVESVRDYLLYTLSLPERALRSGVGIVGGAVRESAGLLVPQAVRDSKTYTVMVQQTLDFLVQNVGGVAQDADAVEQSPQIENFVARKAVGNFVELAGLATLHISPLMLLAVVSDIAYGSQIYLRELAEELRREGVIDAESTIDSTSDLLDAIGRTTGSASTVFDVPPVSLEGLKATLQQTATAASEIDLSDILPKAEIARMWSEMEELANKEHVSLIELSSAMTLHSLDKIATLGRGALSGVRAAGTLLDRNVLGHYRTALGEIRRQGYYATLAEVSGPYIEAVWDNFSTEKATITEDLLNGKLVGQAANVMRRWLGIAKPS